MLKLVARMSKFFAALFTMIDLI